MKNLTIENLIIKSFLHIDLLRIEPDNAKLPNIWYEQYVVKVKKISSYKKKQLHLLTNETVDLKIWDQGLLTCQ